MANGTEIHSANQCFCFVYNKFYLLLFCDIASCAQVLTMANKTLLKIETNNNNFILAVTKKMPDWGEKLKIISYHVYTGARAANQYHKSRNHEEELKVQGTWLIPNCYPVCPLCRIASVSMEIAPKSARRCLWNNFTPGNCMFYKHLL